MIVVVGRIRQPSDSTNVLSTHTRADREDRRGGLSCPYSLVTSPARGGPAGTHHHDPPPATRPPAPSSIERCVLGRQ